jgi:hypothetical protein
MSKRRKAPSTKFLILGATYGAVLFIACLFIFAAISHRYVYLAGAGTGLAVDLATVPPLLRRRSSGSN